MEEETQTASGNIFVSTVDGVDNVFTDSDLVEDTSFAQEAAQAKLETASQIARWIVGILAIFVVISLLLGCCPKSWGLYSPGEIVKEVGSYLAPIITLVFGFFFGKSN